MKTSNLRTLPAAIALSFLFGSAMLSGNDSGEDFSVKGLRCEYLSEPSGIDVQKPRVSWLVNAAPNVRGQSAYRVLVASSAEILQKDQGDLWDSGRVVSAQSTWVEYGGKTLRSGQRAYWKVRVWGEAGKASAWSAKATWSMGLLQSSDWHSKWIGERRPDLAPEGTPLPSPWLTPQSSRIRTQRPPGTGRAGRPSG